MTDITRDDLALRSYAMQGDVNNLKMLLKNGSCSNLAKLYAMFNGILYCHANIVTAMLEAGVIPTSSSDDPILRVLKLCKDPTIIALFDKYTKWVVASPLKIFGGLCFFSFYSLDFSKKEIYNQKRKKGPGPFLRKKGPGHKLPGGWNGKNY